MKAIAQTKRAAVLLAGCLLSAAACVEAAGGGTPPDGVYNCHKISGSSLIGLGNLTIKGKTYRGIGDEGKFAPYTVSGGGDIVWSAGLNGMPEGWKVTKSRYAGNDTFGHPMINIYYVSGSGYSEVIDATKEK